MMKKNMITSRGNYAGLNEHITRDHPDYEYARCLIDQYAEDENVEALLKLYTMETPFYQRLGIRINPLALPDLYAYRGFERAALSRPMLSWNTNNW